jgi:excisionase family DNA binding protein
MIKHDCFTHLQPQRSLSRAKLYAMLNAGEIRGVSIGRSRRIPRSEIERIASEGVAA